MEKQLIQIRLKNGIKDQLIDLIVWPNFSIDIKAMK